MATQETEEQELTILSAFSMVQKFVLSGFDRRHVPYTKTQLAVLAALARHEELCMTQIAECIASAKEQATRAVAPLVRDGLVERYVDEGNRKMVYIRLTERGEDYIREHLRERYAELKRRLSEEDQNRLSQAVSTLVEILGKRR